MESNPNDPIADLQRPEGQEAIAALDDFMRRDPEGFSLLMMTVILKTVSAGIKFVKAMCAEPARRGSKGSKKREKGRVRGRSGR